MPEYDLVFNEDKHLYLVNGVPKPNRSVTQIIANALQLDSSWIDDYYADRGTRNHSWSTLLMQGWVSWWDIDDDCFPFVKNFARIVDRLGLKYISAEVPCYDPEYDVVGTYDLIMDWNGKRVLVELKTSKFEMYHGLQLAAYERMVDVDTVMGIELKTGNIFVPADDWQKNHDTLNDIHSGWFVLEDWKKDRKRRRMIRYKEAA